MVQEIMTHDAHSGMVLAEPALDILGNRLFETGTVLHDRQLRILKAWGVRSVMVQSPDEPDDFQPGQSEDSLLGEAPASEALGGAQTRLIHMFAPHEGNPLMEQIRSIAENQIRHDDEEQGG